jgi:hypothetical protein
MGSSETDAASTESISEGLEVLLNGSSHHHQQQQQNEGRVSGSSSKREHLGMCLCCVLQLKRATIWRSTDDNALKWKKSLSIALFIVLSSIDRGMGTGMVFY